MRATPPCARMSAGTLSRAMTAHAPASSAMRACSAFTTSMMTPPYVRPRNIQDLTEDFICDALTLSIWARPDLTFARHAMRLIHDNVPLEMCQGDSHRRCPGCRSRYP